VPPGRGLHPAPGVLLLATVPADPCEPGGKWYATLDRLLDGWADPALTGHDLAWFGRRLRARGVTTVVDHAW
jgi:hypothetical protein